MKSGRCTVSSTSAPARRFAVGGRLVFLSVLLGLVSLSAAEPPMPTSAPADPIKVLMAREIEGGRKLVVRQRPMPVGALPEVKEKSGPDPIGGRVVPPTRLSVVTVDLVTKDGSEFTLFSRVVMDYELDHGDYIPLEVSLEPGGLLVVLAREPAFGCFSLTIVAPGRAAGGWDVALVFQASFDPKASAVLPPDLELIKPRLTGSLKEGTLGLEIDNRKKGREHVYRYRLVPGNREHRDRLELVDQ